MRREFGVVNGYGDTIDRVGTRAEARELIEQLRPLPDTGDPLDADNWEALLVLEYRDGRRFGPPLTVRDVIGTTAGTVVVNIAAPERTPAEIAEQVRRAIMAYGGW